MLSRWNVTERKSGNHDLLQVQYAFLELPKVPEQGPVAAGAELWAWLFVHAPDLTEVPADLSPGPYRAALELANKATFTQEELDAYQKVIDEIHQVKELAAAKLAEGHKTGLAEGHKAGLAEGHKAGLAEGHKAGKVAAVLAVLTARGLSVTDEARARFEACEDTATLDRWIARAATASSLVDVFGSSETPP
jgi:flagellar biosynthesis/type III secretory pathway protein FliH